MCQSKCYQFFETQTKALVSGVLEAQAAQGCLFNLNVILPELLPGQHQGVLDRVQKASINAGEVFDAMSHLHSMDLGGGQHLHAHPGGKVAHLHSGDEFSKKQAERGAQREEQKSMEVTEGAVGHVPPSLQQLSGASLNIHFGAVVSTPRGCIQAGSLAQTGISFLCFDLDRLTELVHGCDRADFPMQVSITIS